MALTMKFVSCCVALACGMAVSVAHGADNVCVNYQGMTGEPVGLGVRDWSGGSLVAERVASNGTEWPPAPVTLGARRWEPILLQATHMADVQMLAQSLRATTAHAGSFSAPGGYLELVGLNSAGQPVHATRFTNPVVVGVGIPSLPDRSPKFEFELVPDQQLAVSAKCAKAVSEVTGHGRSGASSHRMVGGIGGDRLRLSAEGLEPVPVSRMAGFRYGVNLVGESGGLRSGQMRITPKSRTETVKFTLPAGSHPAWFQWFQDVVVQFKDIRKKLHVTLMDAADRPTLEVVLVDAVPLRWSPVVSETDPVERYVLEVAPTHVEVVVSK